MRPYLELHTRSAFSFLEGASLPEALIARCAALGIPAVALLDRDNVSSAVRFHQATKKAGVRALVRIAGSVIFRQRPGTAKGFLFFSLEDESGIANAIVTPRLFEAERSILARAPFLLIEGRVQNQEGVVSVKAGKVQALETSLMSVESHDFR